LKQCFCKKHGPIASLEEATESYKEAVKNVALDRQAFLEVGTEGAKALQAPDQTDDNNNPQDENTLASSVETSIDAAKASADYAKREALGAEKVKVDAEATAERASAARVEADARATAASQAKLIAERDAVASQAKATAANAKIHTEIVKAAEANTAGDIAGKQMADVALKSAKAEAAAAQVDLKHNIADAETYAQQEGDVSMTEEKHARQEAQADKVAQAEPIGAIHNRWHRQAQIGTPGGEVLAVSMVAARKQAERRGLEESPVTYVNNNGTIFHIYP
jgi:hypothetical protein